MTNTDQSSAGKPSIFVTRRWPADAEAALSQYFVPTFNLDDTPLSAAEMAAGFASHDAIAPTVSDKIGADIIAAGANGKGRLIANFGVGINHIDLGAAATAGIAVSNTPGVLTDATADLALTLILMLSRRAGEGVTSCRRATKSVIILLIQHHSSVICPILTLLQRTAEHSYHSSRACMVDCALTAPHHSPRAQC